MNHIPHARFDDPEVLMALIEDAVSQGVDLDNLDVILTRFAPVDLDLLHKTISWHLQRLPVATPLAA